jgi:predicted DNA-binding transcriptional regulator AlpA
MTASEFEARRQWRQLDHPNPTALTLTAQEVSVLTGYTAHRIRALARNGRFPAPIDPSLNARSWRWSRRLVELWADGQHGVAS